MVIQHSTTSDRDHADGSPSLPTDEEFFAGAFKTLTDFEPFRWQKRLFALFSTGDLPTAIDLPTGLGKTSVMAIWLIARRINPSLPRRLVYVVDRRVVVDQATAEANNLAAAAGEDLTVSTLRGQHADDRKWLEDPSRSAIIVGTIDMIGSRLLFEGYGVSRKMRPYHAGLLGTDTLVVLDEAHLSPPFQALVAAIADDEHFKPRGTERRAIIPPLHHLPLSATGADMGEKPFQLEPEDWSAETQPMVHQRFTASKRLKVHELDEKEKLADVLAKRAWELGEGGKRVLVFCHSHETAKASAEALRKHCKDASRIELIVGKRRVHEREKLVADLEKLGFIGNGGDQSEAAFVVATSAGEVGIDIDADHMVCDLVAFERMVQRLGRVNRRGGVGRDAIVDVFFEPPKPFVSDKYKDDKKRQKAEAAYEAKCGFLLAQRDALALLPNLDDERYDASPKAFADLKARQAETVEKASTPPPLRPALDRAVVDAWSMTALREHTGRPEPDPWLRGWTEDEEPQAQVIWRQWLPWRHGSESPRRDEVEEFFDAARPHASEILETRVSEVADMLIERAVTLRAQRRTGADHGAKERPATSDGIIVLGRAREFKAAKSVHALAELDKASNSAKDDFKKLLIAGTVVVSASLGGLDGKGLIAAGCADPVSCLDGDWSEADVDQIGVRVRRSAVDTSASGDWRKVYRFPLTDDEADEPDSLIVEVRRGAGAGLAGDPAVSKCEQSLDEHHQDTGCEAERLAAELGLDDQHARMLVAAARAHDLGKDRPLWQDAMRAPRDDRPYAKTTAKGDPARLKIGEHTYRHEFGSLRDAEPTISALDLPEDLRDLARHLIAAHHGFARPVIAPVDPKEPPSASEARACQAALRFARLQQQWGPWGLAWWEAVLRAADQRASRMLNEGKR